ncbi:8-oxoguanine DNA glycosylase OGG fold protein [Streptomyces adustus]|uniref:8-oxoguanine DNA glycosylase OGG fold protein n=1 Tax=Streptomyces adustus TaxID=1609272 RepID=UPI0037181A7A
MASQGDMVERLRPLVEVHRSRRQSPVRFRPATWRPWLEPHGAAHVLGLGAMDATSTSGDRVVSRDDLATARQALGDDPEGLRDLFVAVMIWGAGITNGRGPRYTSAALGDARLAHVLEATRSAVRVGELTRAYSEFTLRGVQRSFFTKWFATVDDRDAECERALILDDRVFHSLNALGWSSKKAAGTRRWPARYTAYVGAMHEWAGSLGVTAAWLEWLMFDLNGHVEAP